MGRRAPMRRTQTGSVLLVVVLVLAVLVAGGLDLVTQARDAQAFRAVPSAASASAAAAGKTRPGSTGAASSAPASLRVVALGDSVTAGSACDCDPFPVLYVRGLARQSGRTVRLDNRGAAGATSADVLADLASARGASSVADADVVLVTIGANDFGDVSPSVLDGSCGDDVACAQDDLATMRTHLNKVLAKIRSLRQGRPTAVLLTGYWNVYEDGDVADQDYSKPGQQASDALTRRVNAADRVLATQAGATYVDLYAPFKGATGEHNPTSLLADDGDHPDASGHRLIADVLLSAGTAPLDVAR